MDIRNALSHANYRYELDEDMKFKYSLNLLGYDLSETTFEEIKCLNINGRNYLIETHFTPTLRLFGKTQILPNKEFKNDRINYSILLILTLLLK